jgi:hypothetical protein
MTHRANRQDPRALRLAGAALIALAVLLALQALAPAGASARTIHFHGRQIEVPGSWPVYRLAEHPGMCVQLDRRAVYLGAPAENQRCPASVMGRRRAILVDPAARARATVAPLARSSAARQTASGGSVFTGLGFDACAAPSSSSMSAWSSSPYRAIGVYIGGANRGCSQPNLTASWVSAQVAAGWHLIPTYVGLQAPTSSCSSCAKIVANQATTQGTAAALDAVEQAAAVGMGAGTPIYFDMESYTPGSSASGAVLTFLSAWTTKLHALGYLSGVYSSSSSGIADLAGAIGAGYAEPDALWIANWNGQQNTLDPNVPANAWSQHQRLHQYRGGHNETYGGATINIDNNYLDGPTFGGGGTLPVANSNPVGELDLTGSPVPGQVRVKGWALDPDVPTQTLAIKASVGGRVGAAGAIEYGLGEVANLPRGGIGSKYPGAGSSHGFDTLFPTVKSGKQPVCVYALNSGPGADTLLGCKTINVPVAITLSNPQATPSGVKVRIACAWPEGTACPGQLLLRSQVEVRVRSGRAVRTKLVTRALGRRSFNLTGARSHAYLLGLSPAGRTLLRAHGKLRAQLVAAIPGGKRTLTVGLGG